MNAKSFAPSAALAVAAAIVTLPANALAAPPAKKPAAKPAPKKPAQPAVKGTTQLAGDVGKVGVTYSLPTNSGGEAINLTIHDMYFVATRMTFNGTVVYPDADKKFLVLDGTYQNPNHGEDFEVYTQTVRVTAVDATNANADDGYCVMNVATGKDLDIRLKPGQKVDFKKYLVVPAAVDVPKLIFAWNSPDGKVMRFDLHGVVKPVEPIVADPADKTGATALATVPNAQVGTTYPCGPFDLTIEKFEYVDGPLNGSAPEDGKRYLVATLRAMNATTVDSDITMGNGFTAFLMDDDGDKIDRAGDWLKASADEVADTETAAGIEKRVRIYWPVPKSGGLKTMTMSLGEQYRKLVYDVSNVK